MFRIMSERILVVGSVNMDMLIEVKTLPQEGETIKGLTIRYIPGGKGANQAVAAARLGGKVTFLGKVGSDDFGKTLYKFLQGEKLDTQRLSVSSTNSGIAIITVDGKGENTIVVVSGSNAEVSREYIQENKDLISKSDVVIAQFEIPYESIDKLFTLAKNCGKITIFNPAPAKKIAISLLKKVDYFVINEPELAFYSNIEWETTDIDKIIKAARKLKLHVKKAVIVTLGPDGAVTITDKEIIRTKGIKVKAVDTTAAGDCFVGALAVQLVQKTPLVEALSFANKAAAISVQRWGASSSLPTLDEVQI